MIALYQTTKTKQKLCHMDTDSFVIHIKTEDFMKALLLTSKNSLTHASIR